MLRPGLLLSLLLVSSPVAAQLVETIEVRVANVDVVVTDRDGKPVQGLTKDDFELLENGKPQPITNFYELRESPAAEGQVVQSATPAPPPDLQRRRVIIFFDQEGIDPRRRASVIATLEKSLGKLLRPGDEAMVVTHYRERRIVANLTSDHEAVKRALQEAAAQSVTATTRTSGRERVIANANEMIDFARENPKMMSMAQAYRQSYMTAKSYADELFMMQKRLVDAIKQTVSAMSGLDGKKVFVFVGGDFQARPAVDVLEAIDNMYRPMGVSVTGAAYTGESAQRSLQTDFEKIGRDANTNGITMYLVDASGRGGLTKSAADRGQLEGNEIADAYADIETAMSMNGLAAQTGGRALVGSLNVELALDNLARDLGSYYSLGYKPNGEGERRIVVRVKKPGLVARARRSYTLESSDEQMNDRVAANAFYPMVSNQFAVTVQVGKAEPDGEVFRIPLAVKFPGDLTTIPDGAGQLSGEFGIYVLTASVDGNLSPVVKDVRSFKYPQQHAKAVQAQPITYTMGLRVRAGEQIVSVAVVDRVGGRTGFGRMKFTAP